MFNWEVDILCVGLSGAIIQEWNDQITINKYTIRSIVCKAFCHLIIIILSFFNVKTNKRKNKRTTSGSTGLLRKKWCSHKCLSECNVGTEAQHAKLTAYIVYPAIVCNDDNIPGHTPIFRTRFPQSYKHYKQDSSFIMGTLTLATGTRNQCWYTF